MKKYALCSALFFLIMGSSMQAFDNLIQAVRDKNKEAIKTEIDKKILSAKDLEDFFVTNLIVKMQKYETENFKFLLQSALDNGVSLHNIYEKELFKNAIKNLERNELLQGATRSFEILLTNKIAEQKDLQKQQEEERKRREEELKEQLKKADANLTHLASALKNI